MKTSFLKLVLIITYFLCIPLFVKAQVPGSFDQTFNSYFGFDNKVIAIYTDAEGKKIIGGEFNDYDNTPVSALVRLNADNSIDETWFQGFVDSNVTTVTSICPSSDGGYFIGGTFKFYEGIAVGSIMKLDANGHIDTMFNDTGVGFYYNPEYAPTKIHQLPDNSILISGIYTTYNGVGVKKIFRILPDGNIDPLFNTDLLNIWEIHDFEVLADGNIIVVGELDYTYGGITKYDIAKLDPNGIIDIPFHLSGTGLILGLTYYLNAVEITADNKIIVGGNFTSFNGITKYDLCRLNSDGTLDATFLASPVSSSLVTSLKIYEDKIFVTGYGITIGGYSGEFLTLNLDGSVNTSYQNYEANDYATVLSIGAGGEITVGGEFDEFGNRMENYFIVLNADGTPDESINGYDGANSTVYSIADNLDGKSYAAGAFTIYDKYFVGRIIKLNENGIADTSFHSGTGFNNITRKVVRQSNGRIIVAGDFTSYNGITKNYIARLYPNGTLDPLFSVGSGPASYTTTSIKDIELMSDNKIIVAGNFTTFSGITKTNIVKLFTNGTVDLSFNPAVISNIYCIEIQSDNKIIIGGGFTTVDGVAKKGLARLNVNGSLDLTFNTGLGGYAVYDCDMAPDGKIIIVGNFITYDGVSINRIARLFANGSIDTTFHPGTGTTSTIDFVKVLDDGRILISGAFTTFNGIPVSRMALLNADGSLDMDFNTAAGTGLNGDPYATVLQTTGDILSADGQDNFNSFYYNGICKINGPGCNSIFDTVLASIFEGETYSLPDETIVTTAGTYITTLPYVFDCDSIITTILSVLPLPCEAPGGIFVSNITTTTVKVNWAAVPSATQYNIWYRVPGAPSWTKKNVATTSKKLTGLSPATTYEYKIRSNCSGEYSSFSTLATFTTLPLKSGEAALELPEIYPNPNGGEFNLILPISENRYEISVVNTNGSIVYQNTILDNVANTKIDITGLSSGIYFVLVKSEKNYYSLKLAIH